MKKVGLLLIGICMTLSLFGCTGSGTDKEESQDKDKKEKVIKVGMEVAYPPFEYFKEDETTITGLDHDLAKLIGKELGYKVEFVNTPWDEIFTSLDDNKYDVIMSAITITDERKEKYDFSIPYIQNYQCIVTRDTAKLQPADMSKLDGTIIGCLKESTSSLFLQEYVKDNNIKVEQKDYDVMLDAFTDLKNKKLHAIVCDSTLADQYCKDPSYIMTWKQSDNPEEFAVCFPKGSKYVDEFNKAIETLKKNGELDKLINTYLGK